MNCTVTTNACCRPIAAIRAASPRALRLQPEAEHDLFSWGAQTETISRYHSFCNEAGPGSVASLLAPRRSVACLVFAASVLSISQAPARAAASDRACQLRLLRGPRAAISWFRPARDEDPPCALAPPLDGFRSAAATSTTCPIPRRSPRSAAFFAAMHANFCQPRVPRQAARDRQAGIFPHL